MSTSTDTIEELATREYKYGFVTDVEAEAEPEIPRRFCPKCGTQIVRYAAYCHACGREVERIPH